MDIKIEKKPWYIRYRYYMIAALAFIIFLIYVISLSLGPRKLRIETDNIQIAEVKDDKFMEYVDVEGLVQLWGIERSGFFNDRENGLNISKRFFSLHGLHLLYV